MVSLNNRELATVVAALRDWQQRYGTVLSSGAIKDREVPGPLRGYFDEATPLQVDEIDALIDEVNTVTETGATRLDPHIDEVRCSICKRWCSALKVHRHQDDFIGDECCWDERLRASE